MTDQSHAPGWDHMGSQCASGELAVRRQVQDLVERTIAIGPSSEGTLVFVSPGPNIALDSLAGSSADFVAAVGPLTCLEKNGCAKAASGDQANSGINETPAHFQGCDATHWRPLLQ